MPVNFHYHSDRGYEICQTNGTSTIPVKKLKLHSETDKVECGKGYMAFTEYDQSTYTGTVAFKDATIIEALKEDKEKSNHLFLYEMFHDAKPRPGSDLIITGWSVEVDESVKFNSKTFNCGDKEYHKRDYYTDVDNADIAKTAGKIEEQLLTDFFKAWTDVRRPVRGWEFRHFVQRETRGGSRIPRLRGANPPGGGVPTYDFTIIF